MIIETKKIIFAIQTTTDHNEEKDNLLSFYISPTVGGLHKQNGIQHDVGTGRFIADISARQCLHTAKHTDRGFENRGGHCLPCLVAYTSLGQELHRADG